MGSDDVQPLSNKTETFGQRLALIRKGKGRYDGSSHTSGGMETSWVPSPHQREDTATSSRERRHEKGKGKGKDKRKGVERFGMSLEKGGIDEKVDLSESQRRGRTQRRTGMRSGSKNVFRRSR